MFTRTGLRFLLLLAGMYSAFSVAAQTFTFEKLWGDTVGQYRGLDVAAFTDASSAENFAFLSTCQPTSSADLDIAVMLTNSSGIVQWNNRYDFPGYGADPEKGRILRTADHGFAVYCVLNATTTSGSDLMLMKIDSVGNLQWNRRFDCLAYDFEGSFTITSDGGFIICATVKSPVTNEVDLALIKTDGLGNPQWQYIYDDTLYGSSKDRYVDIDESPYGGYVVSGRRSIGAAAILARFDATGVPLWWNKYASPGGMIPPQLVATNTGYVMAGTAGFSTAVIITDTAGTVLFGWLYHGANANEYGEPHDLSRTSDGGFALTGQTFNSPGIPSPFLIKIDSAGALQWSKRYLASGAPAWGTGLDESPFSGYVLSGISGSWPQTYDSYGIRTDAVGKTYCGEETFIATYQADIFTVTSISPIRFSSLSHAPATIIVTPLLLPDSLLCLAPLAVLETTTLSALQIVPNPSAGQFTLLNTDFSPEAIAFIYDTQGKLLQQFRPVSGKQIDLSPQPAGLYLLVVEDEGHRYSVRLVRE